ncbi:MAG TPA: M13 family metallopeptidase [Kofleriaceae bacterium]
MLRCLFVLIALAGCSARPVATVQQGPSTNGLRFEIGAVDRTADACVDFYDFACGGWRRTHPIPADRPRWSRYAELQASNLERERRLVEGASRAARTPAERRVGAYYAACMDQAGIERRGMAPLRALLEAIDGIGTAADAVRVVAELQQRVAPVLFELYVFPDPREVRRQIVTIDVGALGLDEPDDYGRDDARSAALRDRYRAHVERVLGLIGGGGDGGGGGDAQAAVDARRVIELERRLAGALPAAADRRDPEARFHVLSMRQLAERAPAIDWPAYLRGRGAAVSADGASGDVDVTFVGYLAAVDAAIAGDLPGVRAYLRYHVARAQATVLPAALDAEVFDFAGRTVRGTREMPPRWKRCLGLLDRDLGDDVGQMFVADAFPPASRERARAMVDRIVGALRHDLGALDWLGAAARAAAIRKLENMRFTIGHADRWKHYDGVEVRADDPMGNGQRAIAHEAARELAKLGKPTDRDEFFSLAQQLAGFGTNAMVSVGFTAGYLQPPVFDAAIDDAINFGGFGAVIGHEITHHFDDEGRKFDVDGNVAPWWSDGDVASYQARAACFVDEYARFRIDDGTPVNGRLTLGENLADNGGLRLAWDALRPAATGPAIDGFTPAQRFFLAWAQIRCENTTPQAARAQVLGDGHSPGRFRVNGVVRNMPEFAAAFACPAGAAMAPPARCRLW